MAASTITYADKVQVVDPDVDVTEKYRAVDANEVKTVVNANAALIDTNTATLNALDGTNIELIKGGGIFIDDAVIDIESDLLNKVELGGDIGGTVSAPTVNSGAITNAKLADIPTNRIKGRASSGNGEVEDLTVPQTKTMLSLDNVDNTSDLDKPISTATATALNTLDFDLIALDNAKLNLSGGTMTGAILGDQSIRAYRPVGTTITTSNALGDACATPNTFYQVNSSASGVTITVSDADASSATIGYEWEFFQTDATNGVSFATSGSQTIISEDSYLTRATVGGLLLKYVDTNTWILIGATS